MKGIVFNLLEAIVARQHGDAVWEALLDEAGVDGAYTSLGSYPDEQLFGLVAAAARKLGSSEADVLQSFGRNAMAILAKRYPEFFDSQRSTQAFLLTLNDIIHSVQDRQRQPGPSSRRPTPARDHAPAHRSAAA